MNQSNTPPSEAWRTCAHNWFRYFGPCLRCIKCGAGTMVSMDLKESKPITPPMR